MKPLRRYERMSREYRDSTKQSTENMTVSEIISRYRVSRVTAWRAAQRGYVCVAYHKQHRMETLHPIEMPTHPMLESNDAYIQSAYDTILKGYVHRAYRIDFQHIAQKVGMATQADADACAIRFLNAYRLKRDFQTVISVSW